MPGQTRDDEVTPSPEADETSDREHTGEELVRRYHEAGLQSAFTALLDRTRKRFPVSRIHLALVPLDASFVVTIFDTDSYTSSPTAYRRSDGFLPLLFPERLRDAFIHNDVDPRGEERRLPDFLSPQAFLELRSMMRYPLFQVGHSLFLLNFWATKPHAFPPEALDELRRLTEPLGRALSESLTGFPAPRPLRSAYDLLRLCPCLEDLRGRLQKAARADSTVLLLGETGVGKECAARALHELSPRRPGAFVAVNCGAIPEPLLESVLFGHERGAFTGANATRPGCFEQAHRGTLFLDEIGEMTPSAQIHLLRALENQAITRLGGSVPVPLDVRVVAATHDDLPRKVREGKFRRDLWYRLSVIPLAIPPLRRRKADIMPLARHFLQTKSQRLGQDEPPAIPDKEIAPLYSHDWPGNVRELEHVVERSLVFHEEKTPFHFDFGHLSVDLPSPQEAACASPDLMEDMPTLDELESRYIRTVLARTGGKLLGEHSATEILGIHYTTLRRKMLRLGLTLPRQQQTSARPDQSAGAVQH